VKSNRLSRFYHDLRNLGALSGLNLNIRKEKGYLLVSDRRRVWCLIREADTAWEICFNRYCDEDSRITFIKAIRKITPHEDVLIGIDCVFLSLES